MDSPAPSRSLAPSSQEREAVISALGDAYAADRLELDELERRMARVYRATTRESLAEVLADLQPARPAAAASTAATGFTAARPAPVTLAGLEYGLATLARPEAVPPRQALMAVMGGVERKGGWVVPRQLRIICVMGGVELDFREAQFADGVTEIEITAIMGGVEMLLPAGVRVETVGVGFMGGFSVKNPEADPGPGAPLLRISGLAALGGVEGSMKKLRKK
ncbi:MAG: DUF1707 domain-containing protein [Gemmatimonadaceae bacterium]|nr:DUF1707 domain-containing protein [Gemmatimonadaceae bacterium]